jgi:hypothetical protein
LGKSKIIHGMGGGRRRFSPFDKKENSKMARIKYVVMNTGSKQDINGNVYWYSDVTRTSDGKMIRFCSDGPSNTNSAVKDMSGGDWNNIITYERQDMSIERHEYIRSRLPYYGAIVDEFPVNIKKAFKALSKRRIAK